MGSAYFYGGSQPYCGAPALPASLWSRWNLDPALIAGLLLLLVAYAAACEPRLSARPGMAPWRRLSFYGGWSVGALALVSPLCALSVSLASARVAQHMVLAAVAAPLIALGLPSLRRRLAGGGLIPAIAFAVALWVWHAPGPYQATFDSVAVYWAMHLTAFGAALWLWSAVIADGARNLAQAVAATALTSLQMGLLGAILTFAGRPLFAPHAHTTAAWGLTPLADQQLAGVVMWIPAGLILAAAVVVGLMLTLRGAERRALSAQAAWSAR